jgi:hypothetical protein
MSARQLRRSTIIASPWPPATHIVSSPIVPSIVFFARPGVFIP